MEKMYRFFINNQHSTEQESARVRLMISFSLLEIAFCLICLIFHQQLEFNTPRLLFLLPILLLLSNLFLLRTNLPLKAAKHITIASFWFSFCIGIYFSGGIYSLVTPWLGLLPLMAFSLIDKRSASTWFVIAVFTLLFFSIFQAQLAIQTPSKSIYVVLIAYLGLITMYFSFMRLFHKTETHLLEIIKQKNDSLLEKQEEIVLQNKTLQEQSSKIESINKELAAKVTEIFERNKTLEKHWHTLLEVSKNRSINFGDLEEAMRYITKTAAVSLQVDRVSVWRYSKETSSIQSFILYNLNDDSYEHAPELLSKDFPHYFEALLEDDVIPADDTETNIKISELRESYLRPLHILSMLDAPYFLDGKLGGVVCCEHLEHRHWLPEDILFAQAIADIVTLIIRIGQRRQYELKIRSHKNEIVRVNQSLEDRIRERTQELENQNKKLAEYAFINSHILRGPLCRILGLISLIEHSEIKSKEQELINHLRLSGEELDDVVKKINKAIDIGSHFDRDYLEEGVSKN
jgi:hypothetical protein